MLVKGPLLDVVISIPTVLITALKSQGEQPPPPITGKILLDTGASRTCVDKNVLANLGISPMGRTSVITPSGSSKQNLYPAMISFPRAPFPPIEFSSVIGAELAQQNLVALLGRDMLSQFVYIYNGPGGYITLAL